MANTPYKKKIITNEFGPTVKKIDLLSFDPISDSESQNTLDCILLNNESVDFSGALQLSVEKPGQIFQCAGCNVNCQFIQEDMTINLFGVCQGNNL